MATWKQVRPFKLSKMGKEKGMCLKNTRLAFGIEQARAGFPSAKADMEWNKNKGTLHKMPAPSNVAVPVYVDTTSKYEHVMVCDKGTYYSDGRKLTSVNGMKFFGWGEFCDGLRIVEKVSEPAPATGFKVGDKVTLKSLVDYNGHKLIKTHDYYTISEMHGNRAVLKSGNTVYAAVNTANLTKYNGGGKKETVINYSVRRGDTLSAIAKKYGTTVEKIVKDNKLKNPNLIYPSQRLIIKK